VAATPLEIPTAFCTGPGQLNAHPPVLGVNTPPVGHLDPAFLALMDEVGRCCASNVADGKPSDHCSPAGTGTTAMEATLPMPQTLSFSWGERVFRHSWIWRTIRCGCTALTKPGDKVFTLEELGRIRKASSSHSGVGACGNVHRHANRWKGW